MRGTSAELTDEADAAVDVDGVEVCEISRADWYRVIVWRPELMVELLEEAERAGVADLDRVFARLSLSP